MWGYHHWATAASGSAPCNLPIPNVAALLGVPIDTQVFVITTRLDLLSSNALSSTIGKKQRWPTGKCYMLRLCKGIARLIPRALFRP